MIFIFWKVFLHEVKNIPQTRGDSNEKEQGGKNVFRSELPVYEHADEKAPEKGNGHADAQAAGISQCEEPSSLLLLVHGRCRH